MTEIMKKSAATVATNRTKMQKQFEECREAEAELLQAVLDVTPAIEAICSPIQLTADRTFTSPKMSLWRGIKLAVNGPNALYLDQSHRFMMVKYHADRDADIEILTSELAVREFQVETMISSLSAALDQQLQGKSATRTEEARKRTEFLKSITVLVQQGSKS
jgi:hypothetical protein